MHLKQHSYSNQEAFKVKDHHDFSDECGRIGDPIGASILLGSR